MISSEKEFLYVLGTGNAVVTKCYNTCFAINDGNEVFLVDAGGGNGILTILEQMDIDIPQIHHIFVTHEHTDHILGIIWMVRLVASHMLKGTYQGDLTIYCHANLIDTIMTFCKLSLQKKHFNMIGTRIHLSAVGDGETRQILSWPITFFDIHSTKAEQYGFSMQLKNGKKLTCVGDEPYNPLCQSYVEGSDWLLHEAFCLYEDRERFQPYEKHHSTVKEASELAQSLQVPNLVLWHTEDKTIKTRKVTYSAESRKYYDGNVYVPEDREILAL